MKIVNQVYETHDYSIFKKLDGNRTLSKLHIKNLVRSFNAKYLMSPIIVNENFQVIDGQHRLEAAKTSKLPVYYMICQGYDLEDVHRMNTNMVNWNRYDYLKGYCDLGYPEYLKFKNFMDMYPDFKINACIFMVTNSVNDYKRTTDKDLKSETNTTGAYVVRFFEEGDLIINDFDNACRIADAVMDFKPYYHGFHRAVFVASIVGLLKNPNYNHEQMIHRVKVNQGMIYDCSNVGQYKAMLEEIYNIRSREKVSLRF